MALLALDYSNAGIISNRSFAGNPFASVAPPQLGIRFLLSWHCAININVVEQLHRGLGHDGEIHLMLISI